MNWITLPILVVLYIIYKFKIERMNLIKVFR